MTMPQLYYAEPESLARSRKKALERLAEHEKFYWEYKIAMLDSFFDQPAQERYAWYLAHEPIVPFFAALADLGSMAGVQVKKLSRDYADLQERYAAS